MSNYLEKFEKMRIAGSLASKTLDMITDYVKEGATTNHIDKLCYEFIRDNGGYSAPQFYRGFEKSICTSLNHVVCHGIPGDRTLQDGDIVNIDVTAIINDHYGDTSRMYTVGDISVKSKKLINVTYESLNKAIKILKSELLKKVSLVTPNIPEAEILTGTKIISVEDMIYAANELIELGAKNVLIKGGHSKNKIVKDVFVNKKDIKIFNSARYNTNNTHGTGCTLSSAVTTFVSCGKPAKKSCELGIKYVSSAIKTNPNYGRGHGPINHLTSIRVNRKYN